MTVSEIDNMMHTEEDVIMEVENATVSFDMERGQSRVLNDVSLDIHRNEILGVIGESGSGKSMLASALLDAVVAPGTVSGEITYHPDDREAIDVLGLSREELRQYRWEEVAMVFQGAMSSFNPVRTIRTHFEETLLAHDYDLEEGMARARDLLSDLYLDPDRVLDSYSHELSGGMQQRVLIALSLILEPKMLVMDEPTAALDLLMQRSIISLIDNIKEKYDLTILFITHDLPLVAGLTDRIGVLYGFEFVELGNSHEVLNNPAHPYTQALLQSTPNLSIPLEEMRPIEGEAPDPVAIPSGCSYHSRCPLADEQCKTDDPGPYDVTETHTANCHYWEKATNQTLSGSNKTEHGNGKKPPASHSGDDPKPPASHSGEDPILSLSDLEVHFEKESKGLLDFSDPDTVSAVDGVDLDIYPEDSVILVGESGCGKTTLGKTAIGLQRPTDGTVSYRGQDIWEAHDLIGDISIPFEEIRHRLQIIHQDPGSALNSHKRVRSILETPLKRWANDLDRHDRIERILGMLEYVGMSPPEDYIDRFPHQLSGGEQQRVALIRALLIDSDIILADEAVSALDVSLRVEMMDLMIDLQEEFGTSFLFISHNLSNARYIAEKTGGRIAVMYLGKIVEIGTPEEILNDPKHPYTAALRWATPSLNPSETKENKERPIRKIDVPDPSNIPSGCRYHTRCPEAREVCLNNEPSLIESEHEDGVQHSACFRADESHEYWESEELKEANSEMKSKFE